MEVSIDGIAVAVTPGETVLDAAKRAGRWVPTLCFDDRMAPFGACRVCLVGVEGAPAPLPACTTLCRDGMVVETAEERARRIARNVVELVLSELPEPPAEHTELAANRARARGRRAALDGATHEARHDARHPYLVFQHELCVSFDRCVRACDEIQGAFALTATGRASIRTSPRASTRGSRTPPAYLVELALIPVPPTRSQSFCSSVWPTRACPERGSNG